MMIVVGIDYSPLADLVVSAALEQARKEPRSELHFLHTLPLIESRTESEEAAHRKELQEWLSPKLSALRAGDETPRVVAHLGYGDASEVLVQLANDLLADLVVVGTHGRTGMKRMLMGSVAEAVVRMAGCPVLVMRPNAHHEKVPKIEPPCPVCVETRKNTDGKELWCEQHRERHGRRHTYYNTRHDSWVSHRLIQ